VVTSIDHDSLCADSRSGHHFCYFFSRGKFRVLVRTKIIREEEKVCNVIIGLFLIWCKPNINFFLSYILPTCIFFCFSLVLLSAPPKNPPAPLKLPN
jgi:hypothetical protein